MSFIFRLFKAESARLGRDRFTDRVEYWPFGRLQFPRFAHRRIVPNCYFYLTTDAADRLTIQIKEFSISLHFGSSFDR